jgi:hypothetical protein
MATLNVQFSDSTGATIMAYFASPQDPKAFANQGTVDTSDERWKAYYDAQLPMIQQYLPAPA